MKACINNSTFYVNMELRKILHLHFLSIRESEIKKSNINLSMSDTWISRVPEKYEVKMKCTKILFFTFSSVFTANGVHHSNRPMLEKDDLIDGHWRFLSLIERDEFSGIYTNNVYCQLHQYIVF